MFRNIVVGISGGVDSAVSAYLLKERGFNVLGIFMRNWDEHDETGRCSGEADLRDAEWACRLLDIDLRQVNYVKEYWSAVFTSFLDDYQLGLTPNPDVLCNRHIKFDLFHRHALERLQYDAVATGHYASNSLGNFLESPEQGPQQARLLIPLDKFKDQTFFLSGIPHYSLQRTMFPLGHLHKAQVKQLARRIGLQRLAEKRESTGLCFVGKRDFKTFIGEYISSRPGQFVDIDSGRVVGQHEGIHQWTVGQRCRLSSFLQPYYVARKDVASNVIFVASGHEHAALLSTRLHLQNPFNWLCQQSEQQFNSTQKLRCRFRFQHTKPLVDCYLKATANGQQLEVVLDKPLRAITPGQYGVLYDDLACLGAARILSAQPLNEKEVEVAAGKRSDRITV